MLINKNKKLVFAYLIIGLFNAFMVNFKADYFQKVIDFLADHTLAPYRVVIYGSVLFIGYLMNYVDEYPAKKLEHGIFLDFKLMGLEKISRIAYGEYQKLGTGKLVRGFMEMVVFRMAHQFPNELRKASRAKKEIVDAKVKMNMIHEAFFTIFAILVACLDVAVLMYAWQTKSLSVGAVVALITLIDNAYTPIAIFNVIYVQYKLNRAAFSKYEEFLNMQDDEQLTGGTSPQRFCIEE